LQTHAHTHTHAPSVPRSFVAGPVLRFYSTLHYYHLNMRYHSAYSHYHIITAITLLLLN